MSSTNLSRLRLVAFALVAAIMVPASGFAQSSDLRYQGQAGQQFALDITITVDLPDKVTTLKGIARYTVNSSNAEQLTLTYRGGLNESSKGKASSGGGGGGPPFGPRGFGGPFGPGFRGGPPDFFARPSFMGKVQTTNDITLTPRGGVLALKGDSQLPYLLGNVSLLPFEVLPTGNEKQWKYDSGISIEKSESNDRGSFGPFGRFGPFGPQGDDKKSSQAGQEQADYAIESENDSKVAIKKTYRLTTPAVGDEPALELTGNGTWTFNRKDHMPDSMNFQQKLKIVLKQAEITVPITVVYSRVSPEALAKMDQEALQRQKDAEKKAADEKQKAEAPLTPDEKRSALVALGSGDPKKIEESLKFLRGKSVKDPDSEVAAAIESLLNNSNRKVREDAKAALAKWSPDFARKQKLNEAYTSHMPVASTDREVNSLTPLYVGQIVQFNEHGLSWHAGEIEELEPDGKVVVRDRGFTKRVHTLPRRNIQLAPDEVDQPKRPASVPSTAVASTTTASAAPSSSSASSSAGSMRTWLDATGEFRIEAVYVGFADGKVQLKRADGKEIAVPLDKLCKADQKFVQELQMKKKSDNPFDP